MNRRITLLLAAAVLLIGCGQSTESTAPPPGAANADTTRTTENDVAAMQATFKREQQRIAEERRRDEERKQLRRGFVEVRFEEIDAGGRVVVQLDNRTGKAIDDLRGGFHAEDLEGNIIAASGYTEAVPGNVFLTADQTRSHTPFLGIKEELNERLRNEPDQVRFFFEARAITYDDGSRVEGLED